MAASQHRFYERHGNVSMIDPVSRMMLNAEDDDFHKWRRSGSREPYDEVFQEAEDLSDSSIDRLHKELTALGVESYEWHPAGHGLGLRALRVVDASGNVVVNERAAYGHFAHIPTNKAYIIGSEVHLGGDTRGMLLINYTDLYMIEAYGPTKISDFLKDPQGFAWTSPIEEVWEHLRSIMATLGYKTFQIYEDVFDSPTPAQWVKVVPVVDLTRTALKTACAFCKKPDAKATCGRCKNARYCDTKCQAKGMEAKPCC